MSFGHCNHCLCLLLFIFQLLLCFGHHCGQILSPFHTNFYSPSTHSYLFFTLAKYLFKWSQIKLESTFLGKNTAVQNESYILGRILKVLFTLKVICMSCDEIISRMKMTYQLLFNGCASYKK